jgi:regulator of protease activity HflC (stomatin/prohibitin superfamily)
VAKKYEEVVSAFEKKEARIKRAEGEAMTIRLASAGTAWAKLYDAIKHEDAARTSNSPDSAEWTAEVERILRTEAGGAAREMVAVAKMETLERVFGEKSESERYAMQMTAYEAAPETYLLRIYLRMLEEGLEGVRKYVVALDEPGKVIFELDLKPPEQIDILGAELAASESKEQ